MGYRPRVTSANRPSGKYVVAAEGESHQFVDSLDSGAIHEVSSPRPISRRSTERRRELGGFAVKALTHFISEAYSKLTHE